MSKRNCRGFTLIEFMIVLVIIGILAAIAIPNFFSMQNQGKDGQTKANMKKLENAVKDFRNHNDGALPTATSQLMGMLPDGWYNKQAQRMRNSVTRKFTEPSDVPAPGAFIYSFKDNTYTIIGFDHKGIALPDTLIGGK